MGLNEYCEAAYKAAKDKGFHDGDEKHIAVPLLLIISEVVEAMEADRKNGKVIGYPKRDFLEIEKAANNIGSEIDFPLTFKTYVKDSVEDEIADAAIRIFDFCGSRGIDLEWHVQQKMKYNATREQMHGGKKY